MFSLFGKKKKTQPSVDQVNLDNVRVFYEGEVICGDYDLNNPEDYPFHNLFPHGRGKITYMEGESIVEQYEGEFKGGQYHGRGCLVDKNGEVFDGFFSENCYER